MKSNPILHSFDIWLSDIDLVAFGWFFSAFGVISGKMKVFQSNSLAAGKVAGSLFPAGRHKLCGFSLSTVEMM